MACLVAVAGLLGGCGRSSDTVPAPTGGSSGSGSQTTIQGVATPSSVSVVTAN
jgi:hypothetical protein